MDDTTRNLPPEPQAVADAVRHAMFARDHAAQALGIAVDAVGPGWAQASMTVQVSMLNGFGICQGGIISALADTAFAYACNSYNELTVAAGIVVDFVAPARLGDRLRADAREVGRSGRSGVYDVTVTNQDNATVAMLRGRSFTQKGKPVVAP